MNPDAVDVIETALNAAGKNVKRRGDKLEAQCPAHPDKHPSLSVGHGSTRPAVLHCHAGCAPEDVLRALNLVWTDLGTTEQRDDITATYTYVDANGDPTYRVVRETGKRFYQQSLNRTTGEWVSSMSGVQRVLYHLDEVLKAVEHGETVYVAEGEKDVDRLRNEGVVATCNSGGAGKMSQDGADILSKAAHVILIADDDATGLAHVTDIHAKINGRTKVTVVKARTGKDAFDHLGAGHTIDDFVVVAGETDHEDEDWKRHDLAAIVAEILAGTRERETPTLLEVEGSMPLLYRGRTHSIFGSPGGGKTWVALRAIAERVKRGEHVLMIDWEDNPDGISQRLVYLGCTAEQAALVDYRNPATELKRGAAGLLLASNPWTLVVIDSTGEALAAAGANANDDGEVAAWMMLAKQFARLDSLPAVLLLDHVPKANDQPAAMAIGSQRKLAALTGAGYRCDTIVEPAVGKAGKLRLVVAKDRLGNRPKGSTACEVHLEPDGDNLTITLRPSEAQAAAEKGEKFRPTVLMERVSMHVEDNPGVSRQAILEAVKGKVQALRGAIDVLVEEGWIASETGKRGGAVYHSARSFRESRDAFEVPPAHSGPYPVPGPNPVPTQSRDRENSPKTDPVPPVPRITISGDRGPGPGFVAENQAVPGPQSQEGENVQFDAVTERDETDVVSVF